MRRQGLMFLYLPLMRNYPDSLSRGAIWACFLSDFSRVSVSRGGFWKFSGFLAIRDVLNMLSIQVSDKYVISLLLQMVGSWDLVSGFSVQSSGHLVSITTRRAPFRHIWEDGCLLPTMNLAGNPSEGEGGDWETRAYPLLITTIPPLIKSPAPILNKRCLKRGCMP